MKNISLILNAVLIIAVGILFYLHFSSKKEIAEVKNNQKTDSVPQLSFNIPKNLAGARVLYVDIDSISAKYAAYADLAGKEGGNLESMMRQYQSKSYDLQQRYDLLMQKSQAGTISSDDAEKEQAAINAGMEDLKKMENNITYLQNEAAKKNNDITREVMKYFKDYSKEKKIDYIIGSSGGAAVVMFANDSLNVTNEVVDALNANYKINKPVSDKKK